jgi:hypothetical protein
MIERVAPEVIARERQIYKGVSANVDFYSGFVYSMLDIPLELYTPIFAMARIVGWSAHRLEELINADKIMRPAYKSIVDRIYKKNRERYPNSTATMNHYLFQKDKEIAGLTTAIECIRYKLDPQLRLKYIMQ